MDANDAGAAQAYDPELARIRARLTAEIRSRAASLPGPAALGSASVGPFLAGHERVVVDVWAPWCGPCRALAPVLDALAEDFRGTVTFAKVNADEEPGLVERWGVQAIPTLLLFHRGRIVDRLVGVQPGPLLRERIRRRLDAARADGRPT